MRNAARALVLVALTACLATLAVAAPVPAATRLTPAERTQIDATVDTFVNHAVRRVDVGASYGVVTAAMRGGMSQKQWSRGSIPVYPYLARGQHHPWRIQYRSGNELALELILQPPRKSKHGQILFNLSLKRVGGRWLVDSFQPGATFAPEGGVPRVRAADFMPAGQGEDSVSSEPHRLSPAYVFIPFAGIGLLLLAVIGWILVTTFRDRRQIGSHGQGLPPPPTRLLSRRSR